MSANSAQRPVWLQRAAPECSSETETSRFVGFSTFVGTSTARLVFRSRRTLLPLVRQLLPAVPCVCACGLLIKTCFGNLNAATVDWLGQINLTSKLQR